MYNLNNGQANVSVIWTFQLAGNLLFKSCCFDKQQLCAMKKNAVEWHRKVLQIAEDLEWILGFMLICRGDPVW